MVRNVQWDDGYEDDAPVSALTVIYSFLNYGLTLPVDDCDGLVMLPQVKKISIPVLGHDPLPGRRVLQR